MTKKKLEKKNIPIIIFIRGKQRIFLSFFFQDKDKITTFPETILTTKMGKDCSSYQGKIQCKCAQGVMFIAQENCPTIQMQPHDFFFLLAYTMLQM